jgi:itaconyl-CoA hydratase
MTAPVFGGDTLYAESEIKEKADAIGDANCGQLTVVTRGINQAGKVVCVMEYDMLVYKRGSIPFEKAGY